MMPRWAVYLLLALAALIAAAALGWWLGQPKPVQEHYAPAQHQADGSVMLERKPDPAAKPKQQIPKKAKLERVGRVTVQPERDSLDTGRPNSLDAEPCPPVSVDWSLVREPNGGRRVLASSPDGPIIGGVDVPVDTAAPPAEPLRWAAGLSWSHAQQTGGVWVERDVPLFSKAARMGVELQQDTTTTGADIRLRIGLAF